MDAPDENILGHIVTPWCPTLMEDEPKFQHAFAGFVEAKAHFYPNN